MWLAEAREQLCLRGRYTSVRTETLDGLPYITQWSRRAITLLYPGKNWTHEINVNNIGNKYIRGIPVVIDRDGGVFTCMVDM